MHKHRAPHKRPPKPVWRRDWKSIEAPGVWLGTLFIATAEHAHPVLFVLCMVGSGISIIWACIRVIVDDE